MLLLRRRQNNVVSMNADDAATNLIQPGSCGRIIDSFGTFGVTAYLHFSVRVEGISTLVVLSLMMLQRVVERFCVYFSLQLVTST